MPSDYKPKDIKVPRFNEANGFYTNPQRSRQMSRIKSKNTKPELIFRKVLWDAGIRYRLHLSKLPGNPDIVSMKYKFVVFIDGEFWHGKDWEQKKHKIKSNRSFWIPKIERNIQRDKENILKLKEMGFQVFRFWGNDVRKNPVQCLSEVLLYLKSRKNFR